METTLCTTNAGRGRRLAARLAALAGALALCSPGVAAAQFGRDAVVSRVVELARRDAASATLVGVVESGRLAQGQDVTRAYELTAGSCYWFVAAGDGNVRDLDLQVSYRGAEVARDQSASRDLVVPGERPYCAAETQRVQVRVAASQGGGMYATGIYARTAAAAQGTADDMRAMLDRAAQRYAAGMGQAAEPTTARMAEGEDINVEVPLRGGNCYRFLAVGGTGVQDLALHVYQGAAEVGSDTAEAPEAVASYCATADGGVRMRLHMERGSGEIAIGPYSGGAQPGARAHAAQPEVPVGGDGDDYLARQLRTVHGEVGEGRRGASQVMRATLRTAQDRVFPVQLMAGRCYTIVAIGSPSVRDLDLYLVTPAGLEQARDSTHESRAVISTDPCPRWDGTYSVRARVFAGYGDVAIQVFGN
jgi:hypothetical protein